MRECLLLGRGDVPDTRKSGGGGSLILGREIEGEGLQDASKGMRGGSELSGCIYAWDLA